MIKLISTSILFLMTGIIFGQSFEGTLIYEVTYEFHILEKMKKMGVTEQMFLDKMKKEGALPDSTKTIYKQGDYITYTNFTPQSWSIYKRETNKLYSFQEGDASDMCTVTDVSMDLEFQMTGNKPTVVKMDTTIKVNGIACEVVRVKWKTGTYDYYFNSSMLTVDPTLFENYIYDGWAAFLKISKSLPIQIIKTTNGLSKVTFTLKTQKTENVDEQLFKIPALVPDKALNLIKIANREIMRIKNN